MSVALSLLEACQKGYCFLVFLGGSSIVGVEGSLSKVVTI